MTEHKNVIGLLIGLIITLVIIKATVTPPHQSSTPSDVDRGPQLLHSTTKTKENPSIVIQRIHSEEVELSLNVDSLLKFDEIGYEDPFSNTRMIFKRDEIIYNSSSETIRGFVSVNNSRQPMTITISPQEIFVSMPMESGFFSGYGPPTGVRLIKNRPVSDRITIHDSTQIPPTANKPREVVSRCLNCD